MNLNCEQVPVRRRTTRPNRPLRNWSREAIKKRFHLSEANTIDQSGPIRLRHVEGRRRIDITFVLKAIDLRCANAEISAANEYSLRTINYMEEIHMVGELVGGK